MKSGFRRYWVYIVGAKDVLYERTTIEMLLAWANHSACCCMTNHALTLLSKYILTVGTFISIRHSPVDAHTSTYEDKCVQWSDPLQSAPDLDSTNPRSHTTTYTKI